MRKTVPERKIKRRFLFWPKTLWNADLFDQERRWLEFAAWYQVRQTWARGIWWRDKEWVTKISSRLDANDAAVQSMFGVKTPATKR